MLTVLSLIAELLSTPAVILGLVAGVGLVTLRKSPSEVVTGVLKTMFGFLVLLAGANVTVSALTPFGTMFASAFGLNGALVHYSRLDPRRHPDKAVGVLFGVPWIP